MEEQNIKTYVLDLTNECILHSENSVKSLYLDIKNLYLTQAFFCAKKLQELYFLHYHNPHIQSFYLKFYYFNKKCAESRLSHNEAKELLKELKLIREDLKKSLS